MILIVDDEPMLRDLLSDIISDFGLLSIQSSRPQDVQGIVKEIDIKWIITDIGMPQVNGVELIKQVRQTRPHIRYICISGFTDILESELKNLGVSLVLPKPFDIETFKNKFEALLKNQVSKELQVS